MINNNKKQNSYIKHYTNKLLLILATFFLFFGVANAGTLSDSSGVLTYDSVNMCMADGSVQFTGDVDFGDNEIQNISNINVNSRDLFSSDNQIILTVKQAGGGNYTNITDALLSIPYNYKNRYIINVYNGTYAEDIQIKNIEVAGVTEDEGAITGIRIIGIDSNVRVRSVLFSNCIGSVACKIENIEIYGTEPTSDENVSVSVYGSNSVEINALRFTSNSTYYGILGYSSYLNVKNNYYNGPISAIALKVGSYAAMGDVGECNYGSVSGAFIYTHTASSANIYCNNVTYSTLTNGRSYIFDERNKTFYNVNEFGNSIKFLEGIDGDLNVGSSDITSYNQFFTGTGYTLLGRSSTQYINYSGDSSYNNLLSTGKTFKFGTTDSNDVRIIVNGATKAYFKNDNVFRITPIGSAPASCSIGDIYIDSSGAYCGCSTTNTWENLGSTGTCS